MEVFCYLGRLRFPEQFEAVLKVLPEAERSRAEGFLATIENLSQTELIARWSHLREQEHIEQFREVYQRTGIRLEELSPFIRDCSLQWLVGIHD